MNNISTYLEEKWLNSLRGATYSTTNVYLALLTSASTDSVPGTEVTGAGYERKLVDFSNPVKNEDKSQITNTAELVYESEGDWGTITHFALFDSQTEGNMLYHSQLKSAKIVGAGDELRIPAGSVLVSLG